MLTTPWLPLLDAALRGAMFACLGLLASNLARLPQRRPLENIGLALALGLCVQVLAAWPPVEATPPSGWRAPLVGVSMGNSVLFWLWVRSLCDDDFRPSRRHGAAWAAMVAAGVLNIGWLLPWHMAGAPGEVWTLSETIFALPLLFGLLAVAAALSHWRDDLVERRRWLRSFIVAAGCGYTLLQTGLRHQRPDNRLAPEAAVLDLALLLCVVAAACWLLLRAQRDELTAAPAPATPAPTPAEPPPALPPPDAAEERLAAALHRAMAEQRVYQDPELSVAGLAARLQVPEYRLRRLINQRLGQRNFSAYLNQHRLAEAQAALADPARAHLPVLTLALEAGFGSIGPFNRAFKAHTGLTPTDFRRQTLADS